MHNLSEETLRLRALVGDTNGMYLLGIHYLLGTFGADREQEACHWLWLAKDGGLWLPAWVEDLLKQKRLTPSPPPAAPAPMTQNTPPRLHRTDGAPSKGLLKTIRQAAKQGDGFAMALLGHYTEKGFIHSGRPKKAFFWYQKAAAANCAEGLYAYARCLHEGIGTRPNLTAALQAYLHATHAGHQRAAYTLAGCLLAGGTFPRDDVLAFTLLKSLADDGYHTALPLLAYTYAYGFGTGEDKHQAHALFLETLALKISFKPPRGLEIDTKQLCLDMALFFEAEPARVKAWVWFRLFPDDAYAEMKCAEMLERMSIKERQEVSALAERLSRRK